MFLEIELKLHIQPEDANLLYDHPFIIEHTQNEPELHYLTSIYYDTVDGDLRKNGFGFRVRHCEQHFYQTLKTSGERVGDLHQRHEWEVEITGPEPDLTALSADIREQVENAISGKPLHAIFKTEFQRTSWQLTFADNTQVELALDFGEVNVDARSEQISEIELELKAGDVAKLYEIADVLSKSIPLIVENRSKAARGYDLCSKIAL